MIKQLMILVLTLGLAQNAFAGWGDWFGLEPSILCVAGGGGAYALTTTDSQRGTNAAIGCAVGALVGYGINKYYNNKFGSQYQKDLTDKDRMIQEMQWSQADKILKGEDEDSDGVIILEQIVPAKKLSNGDILMPTKRKKLVVPGEGMRIGK